MVVAVVFFDGFSGKEIGLEAFSFGLFFSVSFFVLQQLMMLTSIKMSSMIVNKPIEKMRIRIKSF